MKQLLDHGYLKYIEHWGSDERVIESARMSTGKGFEGWGPKHTDDCNFIKYCGEICNCGLKPGDEKLLRYLYEHKHHTPFEMAGLTIEVQAPIFVFRQWHKHRTQSYNEASARYMPLENLNYMPSVDRILTRDEDNKQAGTVKGSNQIDFEQAEGYRLLLGRLYKHIDDFYVKTLQDGVPKELARIILPVGRYSRMRASANLRNWLAFLTLRTAKDAQWETRQYAQAVASLVQVHFPRTYQLFVEGQS